jgi:hypothetical protein
MPICTHEGPTVSGTPARSRLHISRLRASRASRLAARSPRPATLPPFTLPRTCSTLCCQVSPTSPRPAAIAPAALDNVFPQSDEGRPGRPISPSGVQPLDAAARRFVWASATDPTADRRGSIARASRGTGCAAQRALLSRSVRRPRIPVREHRTDLPGQTTWQPSRPLTPREVNLGAALSAGSQTDGAQAGRRSAAAGR